MSSPYELFKTSDEHEQKGIELDYGDFQITVARAGGSNRRYQKMLEAKTKPFRRILAAGGKVDPERMSAAMREVFAETVVLAWNGVTDEDGKKLAFNKANVQKLFKDLPELFNDVMNQATNFQLFQDIETEEDKGNS